MHKVNNIKNNRKKCEICPKLTIRMPEWLQWYRFGSLLLTLNIFHTFLYLFYCWLLPGKCLLYIYIYIYIYIYLKCKASNCSKDKPDQLNRSFVYETDEVSFFLLLMILKMTFSGFLQCQTSFIGQFPWKISAVN